MRYIHYQFALVLTEGSSGTHDPVTIVPTILSGGHESSLPAVQTTSDQFHAGPEANRLCRKAGTSAGPSL